MNPHIDDDANLEHLRKQAKQLARACKRGDTDAWGRVQAVYAGFTESTIPLQEAQFVIARENGFSSWPKLVAHFKIDEAPKEEVDDSVLNITNGDSVLEQLKLAGIRGKRMGWNDVLHEGPVPAKHTPAALAKVRAQFLAESLAGDADAILSELHERQLVFEKKRERVVLWFEHDLYDQLQLVQILAELATMKPQPKVELIQAHDYLGRMSLDALRALREKRVEVNDEMFQLAVRTWSAFRAEEPLSLLDIYQSETVHGLPCLKSALLRLFEEYPSVVHGLSRTERQILQAVADGHRSPGKMFKASQDAETAVFMGDAFFWLKVNELMSGKHPLLQVESGAPFVYPPHCNYDDRFRGQVIQLTAAGEAVLAGTRNAIELNGINRWIGGVYLETKCYWLWDSVEQKMSQRSS